jgi:D-aminopeptidase
MSRYCKSLLAVLAVVAAFANGATPASRPRASELGLRIGVLPKGRLDAITDVSGVKVGQTTIIRGDNIRTGVTAVLPHGGNLYRERVPAAVVASNGYGKLTGSTQVEEMGEIEAPIMLTSTDSVPRVADAVIGYMLALPGNEDVLSINAVVGETNDGYLNDIRGRHVTEDDVVHAIREAREGAVEEGSVGAGTGTVAFGWKGGIGTASRRVPANYGGYTVGVLVQTNFGGILTIAGVAVGQELGQYYLRDDVQAQPRQNKPDGSCMVGHRHGCTPGLTQSQASRGTCLVGDGTHRQLGIEWQWRLRDCVFNGAAGPHSYERWRLDPLQ